MDINLIEEMKFKKYKDDIESYFKAMCRGDSFYSHKCMDAIDIYVYRALKPFICANKLSKEKYFTNSIKKKNYRNILIHIMKYIQCINNQYNVYYPEMFDDRNRLKFDEALIVINKITKKYVDLINNISNRSLVLLDESLSSTGSFEGAYIASEVLCGFSMVKCRGIFSTHLHELSSMINDINQKCVLSGGTSIDTLVAGMEEGQRSFKITRAKPDGKSYAKDIADKYGISLEHILKKINQK